MRPVILLVTCSGHLCLILPPALSSLPSRPAISSILLCPVILPSLAMSLLGTLWRVSSHAIAIAVRRTGVCSSAWSRCIVIHLARSNATPTNSVTPRWQGSVLTSAAIGVALRVRTAGTGCVTTDIRCRLSICWCVRRLGRGARMIQRRLGALLAETMAGLRKASTQSGRRGRPGC